MKPSALNPRVQKPADKVGAILRRSRLTHYGLAAALAFGVSLAHSQAQNAPTPASPAATQGPATQPHAMPGHSMPHSMPGHAMHGPQAGAERGSHHQHGGMHVQGHGAGSQHGGGMYAHGHGHRIGEGGATGFSRMLQGLGLDEAQRDRIFGIQHAAAPALREKGKAVRAAHQALASVAMAADYDAARAKAAAEQLARATADLAELRARTHNEVFRVLTAEQQKQLQERRARMQMLGASQGHRHGPHHGQARHG